MKRGREDCIAETRHKDAAVGVSTYRRYAAVSSALCAVSLLLAALLLTLPYRAGAAGVTQSEERGSYYFRLKAKYSHAGQPVDFDIVVACSIRVTRYRGGDSGFLASQYPRFFVLRTHDNHAVMQRVPGACRGMTTENGLVPTDFLPGVIWFDTPGDYRFGIAYVSEDAFENPNSQLKFHGASIQKATRAEWEEFAKGAADNEGLRSRYYDRGHYEPEDGRRIAEGGGKEIEAAYARGCSGVTRYKLSKAARNLLRDYWPVGKPKYWATSSETGGPWPDLIKLERSTPIFADGRRYTQYLNPGNYEYNGFPTRSGAGMIASKSRQKVPPEIFPIRDDRGVPWVFTNEVKTSHYLAKTVEIYTGTGKGFLYCYTNLVPGGTLETPLLDFRVRETRTRVDDKWVETKEPKHWSWPSPFFERDEYLYLEFNIGL